MCAMNMTQVKLMCSVWEMWCVVCVWRMRYVCGECVLWHLYDECDMCVGDDIHTCVHTHINESRQTYKSVESHV